MSKKANKGEWSEPYAAIRILADGRLYLAGSDGCRDLTEWMDVLSLHRSESVQGTGDREVGYYVYSDKGYIEIRIDNVFDKTIDGTIFNHIAELLKDDIISGMTSSFSVSDEVYDFLNAAEFRTLKAKSVNKSDIFLTIRDPRASIVRQNVGFSIKSEFGRPATIFNTAKASAARYLLSNMTDSLMDEINHIIDNRGNAAVTERCQRLLNAGCSLEFVGYPIAKVAKCAAFYENLDNINPRLVNVIERIMWNHFVEGESVRDIPEVVDVLIRKNPCKVTNPETKYPTMIKSFLYAGYCGMTASTLWKGDNQVKGGFISVNKNGEVMAYYAIESDAFKNYLYDRCFVDYPSTSPGHGDYGTVYKEGEQYYFNLNFQIKIH